MKNRPWTKADVKWLRACAKDGDSSSTAAMYLGRTTAACKYKAMTLSPPVRFRSIDQTVRNQSRIQKARFRKARRSAK